MGLTEFQQYIKTQSVEQLHAIGLELEGKLKRARKPDIKLGYATAIDLVTCEIEMRKPLVVDIEFTSDQDLLDALLSDCMESDRVRLQAQNAIATA